MKTKHIFSAVLLTIAFTSCIKNKTFRTITLQIPHYNIKNEIKEQARVQEPQALVNLGSFAIYNGAMFINEKNKGLHVIDYSNPSTPINKGFIPIPGNTGLSIKNDVLYADCYSALMVFKVNSKENIELQNTVENVFLSRVSTNSYDKSAVEITWTKRDTVVTDEYYQNNYNGGIACGDAILVDSRFDGYTIGPQSNGAGGGGVSIGSSLAVFAIVNNHLYTVDNSNLNTFSLRSAYQPELESTQHVTGNVESLFPFKDKLFIGSMTGMFIYGLTDPDKPRYISQFNHVRVCDPVIADDNFAFVTLRNGSRCGGFINQMDILNIEDINNPTLVRSINFTNPHGLSKDGKVLFVCDGVAGLRVLDAGDVNKLASKQTFKIGKVIDVVAHNQIAFVMLEEAIQLYSYDQQFNIHLLGSINKN